MVISRGAELSFKNQIGDSAPQNVCTHLPFHSVCVVLLPTDFAPLVVMQISQNVGVAARHNDINRA